MKIVYLRGAISDLEAIHNYIAKDSAAAASRVVARIQDAARRLEHLPYSARPGPGGTRLLSVPGLPYIVIYRVAGDAVKIVAVFHTARNRKF